MFKAMPSDTNLDNQQHEHDNLSQEALGPSMYIEHVMSEMKTQNHKFNTDHKNHVFLKYKSGYIQASSLQSGWMLQQIWNGHPHKILNAIDITKGYNYSTYNRSISIRLNTLKKTNKQVASALSNSFKSIKGIKGTIVNPILSACSSVMLSDVQSRLEYDKAHPTEGKRHRTVAWHRIILHSLYKMTKQMTIKNPYYKNDYLNSTPNIVYDRSLLKASEISNRNRLPKRKAKDIKSRLRLCRRDINTFTKRRYHYLRHEIHDNYAGIFKGKTNTNVLIGYAEDPVLGDIYKMTAGYQKLHGANKADKRSFIKKGQKIIGNELYKLDGLHNNKGIYYHSRHQLKIDQNIVNNQIKLGSKAMDTVKQNTLSTKQQDEKHNQESQKAAQQKRSKQSNGIINNNSRTYNVSVKHGNNQNFSIE